MKKEFCLSYATIILVVCVLFCSCGGINSFREHIQAGQYLEAISDYQKYIYGTIEKENEAKTFIAEYLSDSMEKYSSGEISEMEMENILACLQKVNDELSIVGEELLQATETFTSQILEKKCVKLIEAYFDAIQDIDVGDKLITVSDLEKLKEVFLHHNIVEYPTVDGHAYDAYIEGDPGGDNYGKRLNDYEIIRTYSILQEDTDTQRKLKDFFVEHCSPELGKFISKVDNIFEMDCYVTFQNSSESFLYDFTFAQSGKSVEILFVNLYTQGDDVDKKGGLLRYYIETTI